MDQIIDVIVCLSCRHPAQEHMEYVGCLHQVPILSDAKPLTCVCIDLEV
jgi:hypothetical protein